ncbi:T9SS type A sorting domain-containing protein [Belliella sp. DSM 111904]|uniref:T9SS type A sorting domain-containing protein n=1 Tax=Belliella filtrata TaxID=2923435 RepID=A0ABS9V506_9BACT|nr:T9SS type A sorting domain-containing protein [Belliella filtrata]MCH7411270.1 T9SS type A sorting domain-containing protein [Belliella filtrata]
MPFEDYHSAINYQSVHHNENHSLLTLGTTENKGNIRWFMEKLNVTYSPAAPSSQSIIVLQGETMNYGVPGGGNMTPPETRLRNMDILANGKAAVNSLDNVGLPFQQLLPPVGGSYFSVSTQASECGGTYCKVDNDGVFQVGEFFSSAPTSSTTGQAIFLENSTLEILPGGKLVIERQSRLIIEEGATLIIHPGAEIYLNDATAILEIKGKIELKDNAVFTFTSEDPENYGHVIFNQRQWDDGGEIPVEEYWEVGENASLEFQGVGQHGKVLMECKQNFRSKDLSLIKITNGTVDIHEHITANLTANSLYLEYLRVKGHAENNHPHHGIQVWGMNHQTAHIRFNKFQDGAWGIRGYQLGEQIPLMVLQCDFTNNENALYFNNGSFWVHSCTFDSSSEGIVSEAASGSSTVESSQFNGTHAPIVVESDVSSSLEVRGCDFDGSGTVHETAILHNTIDLRLKCSKIEDYHIGINTINASVDLSNDGGNRIYSTVFAILLDEATSIYFHNGENILAGNIIDVLGDLASTDPLVMVNHNGGDKINALDNNLQATSTGFKTHIFESGTSTPIPLHCQSFHLTPDCREPSIVMNHPFDTLIGNIPTDIYVDVEGVSMPFSLGLLQVTGDVFNNEGYEAHLYDALVDVRNIMDEVSQQVYSGSSDGTKKAFRIGFSMMFDILRKCYHYDVLQAVGADPGAPVNPYINSMNNYIDDIIGFIPSGADYDEQVAIQHIIRAHVYRLAQHHQFALYALSQVGGDISPQTEDRKEYWNCLIYWEMEMLLGNITMEDYNQQFITCGMMFSPYKTYEDEDRFAEWEEKVKREGQLSIYPNPAMDNIYVRMENIASPEDEVVITITASDGKTVLTRKEQSSFLIGVNVSELSQGAYTLTVKTPYKTHNGQFLIAR